VLVARPGARWRRGAPGVATGLPGPTRGVVCWNSATDRNQELCARYRSHRCVRALFSTEQRENAGSRVCDDRIVYVAMIRIAAREYRSVVRREGRATTWWTDGEWMARSHRRENGLDNLVLAIGPGRPSARALVLNRLTPWPEVAGRAREGWSAFAIGSSYAEASAVMSRERPGTGGERQWGCDEGGRERSSRRVRPPLARRQIPWSNAARPRDRPLPARRRKAPARPRIETESRGP
jgi:hypothetical protein